ncbi:MAG: signal peptidase I [bacterium]|nr:signal peptidase I [bacterium]
MKKTVLREYYEAILVAFILALFVRTFVFENFKIPSGSMENNLLVGDHLVVNKFVFAENAESILHRVFPYREPRRGDVVVFKYPEDPRRDFIKRCAAIAGDTVEIRAKQLYVNGTPRDEWYVVHKDERTFPNSDHIPLSKRVRDHFGPYVVPEGAIFCLGDNRDLSLDSRFWGPVPLSYVKGRAVLIYWSYEADRNDWQWRGVLYRIKQLGEVFIHFFTKTRWERQFKIIR